MSETNDTKPAKKAAKPASGSERPGNETTRPKAATQEHAHAAPQHDGTQPIVIKGKALATRGRVFIGKVVSNRMSKTVTVEWERRKYVPKYQRYEKRRTRVKAHDETNANIGDLVEIMETRPISKTKHFLVLRAVKAAGQK